MPRRRPVRSLEGQRTGRLRAHEKRRASRLLKKTCFSLSLTSSFSPVEIMLTVPWFLARTVQRAWAYNTDIPSSSGTVIASPSSEQRQKSKVQQKVQSLNQKASAGVQPKVTKASVQSTTSQEKPGDDKSVKTSKTTLILKPSVSGGRMSEQWAQQQIEKFQFDFNQADKDKSGYLSFAEVFAVLKTVGFRGSEDEAKFIFGQLDKNKDSQISRDEFTIAMKGLPRLTIKEFVLRKAFLALDKDGSGFLTRSEIEDATKADAGIDIAASKISDLLIYLCKEDKDQKVDYEEFLRVFDVESTASVMSQVFKKLDADNSGFLTRDEILEAVKAEFELKLKVEKISDLLCYWCKDADKKISYDEFVNVWLQQKK